MDIAAWVLVPLVWLIGGVVLCFAELLDGNRVLLPLGLAAVLVAGYLHVQKRGLLPNEVELMDWRYVLLAYAGLAVASVVLLRRVFRPKPDSKDINDY
ncbi:MAG: hypothetical protein OXU77_15970 [Gammaproteobacteria bacterium]|nr:hypothetical protein [Gammaproteobacteria bacterium]MDE0441241.1 hypothetical protein [Gammaproteobacteria bacterium]